MRLMKLALAGVCALGLFGVGTANSAEPVKIRMSWVAPIANWGSIVLEKKDLAQHMGKSYTLEAIHYPGTPQMITAIANNELEVASLAYSSLAIAIENAGLDDIRVIADEFQDGVPGYYSEQFYVRKDSGINKVEDLKGKVIGTNGGGSAVDVAMRAMLNKHGLEEKRDYTMLEGPLPAMPAMLLEKKVDLIPAVLPFSLNPKLREDGKVLFEQRDIARRDAVDHVDRAQVVHRQAPRRHGRLHGGHAAHRALVSRPEEPRRGRQDRLQDHQGAAGAVRLAVHQDRHLPRPESDAEPRRAAEQRRHHARSRLRQEADRHFQIRRPEPGAGGGQAPQVTPIHNQAAAPANSAGGFFVAGNAPRVRCA